MYGVLSTVSNLVIQSRASQRRDTRFHSLIIENDYVK